MRFTLKTFSVALVIALLSTPAWAYNSPFVSRDKPHGVLQMSILRQAHQIYPVYVFAVNGHLISRRQTTLWIKPGTYNLTFIMANAENGSLTGNYHAPVDLSIAPGLTRRITNYHEEQNRMKIKVKAGKTYYIGAKVVRPPRNWKPVIWKREKTGS